MKANNILWAVCLSIFTIISCKKNNDAPTAAQKILLTKADYASVGAYTYAYDISNRLLTETYAGNALNPASITTVSNYDTKGRVIELIVKYTTTAGYVDNKVSISYNSDGKVERKQSSNLDGTNTGYSFFEYSSGKVTEKYYSASNSLLFSYEYTLSADGANIISYKNFNSTGTLTSTTTYSNFDTKNNSDGLFPYGFIDGPVNKNNWQTLSRTNNLTGVTTGYTVTYEYNSDGYPVKRTGSTGGDIAYEYTKK